MKASEKQNVQFFYASRTARISGDIFRTMAVLMLTLLITGWSSALTGQAAQQNKKKVQKHKTLLKLPLEVIGAMSGEKPITLGEEFDGDADWLNDLRIKLINRSDKTITWASIYFTFPETRLIGPVMAEQLFVGRREDQRLNNTPLSLKPGAELEVSFTSNQHLIPLGKLQNLSIVDIEVSEVMFDDGTLYSGDAIWKRNPDPGSAHKWLKVRDYTVRP